MRRCGLDGCNRWTRWAECGLDHDLSEVTDEELAVWDDGSLHDISLEQMEEMLADPAAERDFILEAATAWSPVVRRMVARRHVLPREIQMILARDPDEGVQMILVNRPDIDGSILDTLSYSHSAAVRRVVASRFTLWVPTQMRLACDESPDVVSTLVVNLTALDSVILLATHNSDESVSSEADTTMLRRLRQNISH